MNDTIQTIAAVVSSLTGVAALIISLRKEASPRQQDSLVITDSKTLDAGIPYQTESQKNLKARENIGFFRLAVGLLFPGLVFLSVEGWESGKSGFIKTIIFIVCGFIFFGPIWGEILFPSSDLKEAGLIPFIICISGAYLVSYFTVIRASR